jgi:hypothetical protein
MRKGIISDEYRFFFITSSHSCGKFRMQQHKMPKLSIHAVQRDRYYDGMDDGNDAQADALFLQEQAINPAQWTQHCRQSIKRSPDMLQPQKICLLLPEL